ncbi:unnamed protein product, partial [Lymnaea stagnalis]
MEDAPLFSEWDKQVFIVVNHVALSTLICLFGFVGNVINICVFVKQGLGKAINSSLFAIAISDILEIVFQIWHNLCLNPYLLELDSDLDLDQIQYLTAGWPSLVLVRITSWVTVYITAERCLSIALPLKIKQIVTPRRTAAILAFIFAINVASVVPLYFSAYFSWNFYPARNKTRLGISFRSNQLYIDHLLTLFQASLTIIAFVFVVVFTTVLVAKLKQNSKWRRRTTSSDDRQTGWMSGKERRTVAMAIAVAVVLIVCLTPDVIFTLMTSSDPSFGITGKETNVFQAAWSFAFLLHSVNSSITILLYYKTSTRYRQTFQEMFPR